MVVHFGSTKYNAIRTESWNMFGVMGLTGEGAFYLFIGQIKFN